MRTVWLTVLVLVAIVALGRSVAMLPPDVFKEPIFASGSSGGDSSDSGGEYTEFA